MRIEDIEDEAWERMLETAQLRAWERGRALSLSRRECDRLAGLAVDSVREALQLWGRPMAAG